MKHHVCARRIGVCVIFGCACLTGPPRADAQQWQTVPDIALEAETNDNPALFAGAGAAAIEDASRVLADVRVRFRRDDPRGTLSFEPRVRSDAYSDDAAQQLESTDVFLRSNGEHRGATVRVGYNADIARERILGVEFLETLDPVGDDPSEVTTTQVGVNERRTRLGLSPYVDITLNSRGALRLDGRLVDVDYTRGATGGLTDFVEKALGGEYRRQLDQRGTLATRVFATGYEAALNNNSTDTWGIELNYERAVTELWSWHLGGGTQRADYSLSTGGRRIRDTESLGLFNVGVMKEGEVSTVRADFQRRMSPDSLGFVAARNELRVAWQRMLTARVNGRIVLRAIDAEGLSTVADSDRQYGRAEVDVEWQFRPTWWFTAGYAHANANGTATTALDQSADSNSLTIGVRYRGRSTPSQSSSPLGR